MRYSSRGRIRQQVGFLRRQFLQDSGLPLSNVLSERMIAQALTAISVSWLDRIYTPLVTLWVFLSQVLSADHSCRSAVARLVAHRLSRGQRPCSPETGAYCQARKRLPEKFFSAVACAVGRALDAKADSDWLWKGRRVYLFDGTTVTMPDTPENQETYPQVYNQKLGLGFPIARLGAMISLSCGSIVNLGFCRYAGKGQGEVSLLRRLWNVLHPGDVLLTDCLLANWTNIVLLQKRGVELVSRLNKANRKADFRRGKRLGNEDHIVCWRKPSGIRSLDWQTYKSLPDSITIREARIRVAQPGFRTKCIVVVTTLLDPRQTTKDDLATLYRARWNNEVYQPEYPSKPRACISSSPEIKVSAGRVAEVGMLKVASQRGADSNAFTDLHEQGGSPCLDRPPPAPAGDTFAHGDGHSSGSTLDADSIDTASGTTRTTDANSGSAIGCPDPKGGSR